MKPVSLLEFQRRPPDSRGHLHFQTLDKEGLRFFDCLTSTASPGTTITPTLLPFVGWLPGPAKTKALSHTLGMSMGAHNGVFVGFPNQKRASIQSIPQNTNAGRLTQIHIRLPNRVCLLTPHFWCSWRPTCTSRAIRRRTFDPGSRKEEMDSDGTPETNVLPLELSQVFQAPP